MNYKSTVFLSHCYHSIARYVMPRLPIPEPEVIEGNDALSHLTSYLLRRNIKRPVIFTDGFFSTLPEFKMLTDALDTGKVDYAVFNKIKPDPTYAIVKEGIRTCHEHNYDCAIAIGGGSTIDGTKMINVCAKNNINPELVKNGLCSVFQMRKKGALFVAIPTTSGTGSEATTVTVVTDENTGQKHGLMSFSIVPDIAIFDPRLTANLPPSITAMTGMDALTHAMESYLSTYATPKTDVVNMRSIKNILAYLPRAYEAGPDDMVARSMLARASFDAGRMFSKTMLGWAHGISHQLGAYYKVPHGLGCAKALPHVMQFLLPTQVKRLAILADYLNIHATGDNEKAQQVVDAVFELCKKIDIAPTFEMIKEEHVGEIAKNIIKEGVLAYPSSRYFDSFSHLEGFLLERRT